MRLSRAELRTRFHELRDLVNGWDPIGVLADPAWPRDEYECIVGPLLRRLEARNTVLEIAAFLRHEFTHHFGLGVSSATASAWAEQAVRWFEEQWPNTESVPQDHVSS